MGTASRTKQARRRAQAVRSGGAGELADRAAWAAEVVRRSAEESVNTHPGIAGRARVDLARAHESRERLLAQGEQWPSWCYLPYRHVELGLISGTPWAEVVEGPSVAQFQFGAAVPLATLAAWEAGRTVVRWDPDLLTAVLGSTLGEHPLPVEVLHRLPAWGLYLDCPHIADGVGAFVSFDDDYGSGVEPVEPELFIVFVRPESPHVVATSLWLGQGSLGEALAAQDRSMAGKGRPPQAVHQAIQQLLGHDRASLLAGVVSMLLYLCAEEPDLQKRLVPSVTQPEGRARAGPGPTTRLVNAGYRIGPALRRAANSRRTEGGTGEGRTVVPHLRAPHFALYWRGPRNNPSQRYPVVRWLAPILVHADQLSEMVPVVRGVDRTTGA